ncbi:MAG: GxxExxY protein [Rhodospirillaceae bacterium]|nr:GxxExxY protein [Rhodospirillales bacterium]
MNTDAAEQKDPLTGAILRAAFEVAGTLGHGFLESVYQRALAYELELAGLKVTREVPFKVKYKGREMGTYLADLVVEGSIIVELKAIDAAIGLPQISQCLNYLRASGLKTALILNFGRPRVEYKRVALT